MDTLLEFLYKTRFLPEEEDLLKKNGFSLIDKFTATKISTKHKDGYKTGVINAGRTVFQANITKDVRMGVPTVLKEKEFKHLIGAITFVNDNLH